jgi:hypothetical protein
MPTRTPPASFVVGKKLTIAATKLGAVTQTAPSTSTTGGTGLAASTAYYYVVTVLNANGEGAPKSNEQTVTTGAGATNSNTVNWTSVAGATGYRVYRSLVSGVYTGVSYYDVGAVTTKVDTGAAPTGTGTPPTIDTTGDKVYNAGDSITNAAVKSVGRRLGYLLSRRFIVPATEVYPKVKSSAIERRRKPKPTWLNDNEKAGL